MAQRPVRDVIAQKKQRPLLLSATTTVLEAARRMKRQAVGAAMIARYFA